MTGYADQRERAHGLDALIHDVITKPFSLATIRAAVNDALAAGAAGTRIRPRGTGRQRPRRMACRPLTPSLLEAQ